MFKLINDKMLNENIPVKLIIIFIKSNNLQNVQTGLDWIILSINILDITIQTGLDWII